jgi:hypothetical protein
MHAHQLRCAAGRLKKLASLGQTTAHDTSPCTSPSSHVPCRHLLTSCPPAATTPTRNDSYHSRASLRVYSLSGFDSDPGWDRERGRGSRVFSILVFQWNILIISLSSLRALKSCHTHHMHTPTIFSPSTPRHAHRSTTSSLRVAADEVRHDDVHPQVRRQPGGLAVADEHHLHRVCACGRGEQ